MQQRPHHQSTYAWPFLCTLPPANEEASNVNLPFGGIEVAWDGLNPGGLWSNDGLMVFDWSRCDRGFHVLANRSSESTVTSGSGSGGIGRVVMT